MMNKFNNIIKAIQPKVFDETESAIDFLNDDLAQGYTLELNDFNLIMSSGMTDKTYLGQFAEPVDDIIDYLANEFSFEEYLDKPHNNTVLKELIAKVKKQLKGFMPVYAYIHGSEFYSTSPIATSHYGFDSGLIGYIYSENATDEELSNLIKHISATINDVFYGVMFNEDMINSVEEINTKSVGKALNEYKMELERKLQEVKELMEDKTEVNKIVQQFQDEVSAYLK